MKVSVSYRFVSRRINTKDSILDTWIFPLVQMGQLGVVQDVQVTAKIFGDALPGTRMNIATAYFNLTHDYVRSLIFKSKAECNLLMAHPEVHIHSVFQVKI